MDRVRPCVVLLLFLTATVYAAEAEEGDSGPVSPVSPAQELIAHTDRVKARQSQTQDKPEGPKALPAREAAESEVGAEPESPDAIRKMLEGDASAQKQFMAGWLSHYDAYRRYRISGFTHRQQVFEWQLLSSKIIFGVVVCLVVVGVYFSAVQFGRGRDTQRRTGSRPAAGGPEMDPESPAGPRTAAPADADDATELIVSLKEGLKVKSSVLGIVILALALIFFYLYLVHVYPITEVF
jgi:hypothetical protein